MKTNLVGKLAIKGLGYLGLPYAVEFDKKFSSFGLEIDLVRVFANRWLRLQSLND